MTKKILLTLVCVFIGISNLLAQNTSKKGDVNNDRYVDISDIVFVINTIARNETISVCDVNKDGKIDISDIVAIINIIANGANEYNEITVITGEAINITDATVCLSGTVENVTEAVNVGFVYGQTKTLSASENKTLMTTSESEYTLDLSGLRASNTYYYCAFAEIDGSYYYGEIKSFKTASLPSFTITTYDATDIKEEGAKLWGEISITNATRDYTVGFLINTNSNLSWSDSEKFEAGTNIRGSFSISVDGLSSNTTYYIRAYLLYGGSLDYYGERKYFTTKKASSGILNGHEWIDLGLPSGLKWATCNVLANSPSGYGKYYAWGELAPGDIFGQGYYRYYGSRTIPTDISGTEYDIAHMDWGSTWRMPTFSEVTELKNYTTFEWTSIDGVAGAQLTGRNGNKIFMPAGGAIGPMVSSPYTVMNSGKNGNYWTSTLYGRENGNMSNYLFFNNSGLSTTMTFLGSRSSNYTNSYNGMLIRPVTK